MSISYIVKLCFQLTILSMYSSSGRTPPCDTSYPCAHTFHFIRWCLWCHRAMVDLVSVAATSRLERHMPAYHAAFHEVQHERWYVLQQMDSFRVAAAATVQAWAAVNNDHRGGCCAFSAYQTVAPFARMQPERRVMRMLTRLVRAVVDEPKRAPRSVCARGMYCVIFAHAAR